MQTALLLKHQILYGWPNTANVQSRSRMSMGTELARVEICVMRAIITLKYRLYIYILLYNNL